MDSYLTDVRASVNMWVNLRKRSIGLLVKSVGCMDEKRRISQIGASVVQDLAPTCPQWTSLLLSLGASNHSPLRNWTLKVEKSRGSRAVCRATHTYIDTHTCGCLLFGLPAVIQLAVAYDPADRTDNRATDRATGWLARVISSIRLAKSRESSEHWREVISYGGLFQVSRCARWLMMCWLRWTVTSTNVAGILACAPTIAVHIIDDDM